MKNFYLISIFAFFICFFAFSNPQLADSQDTEVLVNIGTESITAKEFMDAIEKLPKSVKERVQTDAGKEDFLRELVRVEVFSKEAKAIGIDKEKDFQDRLSRMIKTLLATEYTKREVIEKASITDEEAKKYYEKNLDDYKIAERIKLSQIALVLPADATPAVVQEKETLIKSIFQRVKDGEDFTKLAKEFTEDPLKGTSKEYTRGALPPEIENDVFNLKVGEISPVLKVRNIFVIFKLDEKIPEEALSFEEAKGVIIEKLQDEKKIKLFESKEKELFSKYNVKIHPNKKQN